MFRTVSSASATDRPRRYNVDPMYDNQSVHWALMHSYARDPEYAKAVIRSYVNIKRSHGRLGNEIASKLHILELQLPQFAEAFHAVRAEYGLPPSRALPPQSGLAANASRLSLTPSISRLSQQAPASPRRSSERIRRTTPPNDAALPADFRVRPQAAAEEELPPPPYARQDPEPDSTRLLQERLAAEAATSLPLDTTPASPRPTSTRFDSRRASSNSQRPHIPVRTPSPPHEPEDPEIARAMEENELEEAKRASMASERERKELEEAMRLSLAAESTGAGPGQSGPASGPASGSSRLPAVQEGMLAPTPSAQPPRAPQLAMPGGLSLLDSDDADGMQQAPLVPQKTGAVMQSRNPFFAPGEASSGPTKQQVGLAEAETSRTGGEPLRGGTSDAERSLGRAAIDGLGGFATRLTPQKDLPPSPAGRALPRPPTSQPREPQQAHEHISLAGQQPFPNRQTATAEPNPDDTAHSPSGPLLLPPMSTVHVPPARAIDPNDPLHSLTYYDVVFLVDDSPSMAGARWDRAKDVLTQVAGTAMRYAADGVDVYFTSSKRVGRELRSTDDIDELLGGLQARGTGSTGYRLRNILRDYTERLPHELFSPGGASRREMRPMNLVVITDGVCAMPSLHRSLEAGEQGLAPSDLLHARPEDDLQRVIVECAMELDRDNQPASQIGIQFIQIGDEPQAREALQQLDDSLSTVYNVRDMVDTVSIPDHEVVIDVERIKKTLFGGIDRGWDEYALE